MEFPKELKQLIDIMKRIDPITLRDLQTYMLHFNMDDKNATRIITEIGSSLYYLGISDFLDHHLLRDYRSMIKEIDLIPVYEVFMLSAPKTVQSDMNAYYQYGYYTEQYRQSQNLVKQVSKKKENK